MPCSGSGLGLILMLRGRTLTRTIGALVGCTIAVAGCASMRGTEWTEEQKEILRLEQLLSLTRDELSQRNDTIGNREAEIAQLEERIANLSESIEEAAESAAQSDTAAREEINRLETELASLQADFDRLSRALDTAAAEAEAARQATAEAELRLELALNPPEVAPSDEERAAERAAAEALEQARRSGEYQTVRRLGFTRDSRLTNRLNLADSGLAVDSTGAVPVIFDPGFSYAASRIFLTVADPLDQPSLGITIQYVSDTTPLFAQTSFISIEGSDPLDPVDPIIFSGNPVRQTDGRYLRESFSREVDRDLLTRISRMLATGSFSSTFVGPGGRETHEPSQAERDAMSRMLFVFIDLGGFR